MTDEVKEEGSNKKGGSKPKGFAANPHLINRGGRPKGSRNKSSLIKAQFKLDDMTEQAAHILEALMNNDKEALGIDTDVPATIRLNACKEILNKSIANEKDKLDKTPDKEEKSAEEVPAGPIFSPIPIENS